MQVLVRDNNVDQALRVLKKKMQREGMFREMKARRSYEKPSEKRVREKQEALHEHVDRPVPQRRSGRDDLPVAPRRLHREGGRQRSARREHLG